MSVTINGTNGLVFNDNSSQASAQVGMKNRLIDAGFIINQRVYVSGTSLSSGVYAHDRWKAGSSGCTYTFTQGSVGVPITITITAGSLQQVIEGCNMPEGGTYTISWSGTAQAKVNGGSYSASPITATGLTAGANCTVEFGTGTVTKPQIEVGSTATSFDYRPYGTELALCQRYGLQMAVSGYDNYQYYAIGYLYNTTQGTYTTYLPVPMRTTPTITQSGTLTAANLSINISSLAAPTSQIGAILTGDFTLVSSTTSGNAAFIRFANVSTKSLFLSAEL